MIVHKDFLSCIHQIYVSNCLIFWRIQKNLRGMQMVVHDELKTISYGLMRTWILVLFESETLLC